MLTLLSLPTASPFHNVLRQRALLRLALLDEVRPHPSFRAHPSGDLLRAATLSAILRRAYQLCTVVGAHKRAH